MKAVIVIELDVTENSDDLTEAARIVREAEPPHAARMYLAIHEPADQVLDIFDTEEQADA